MPSTASTAEVHVKCILASFLLILLSGGFTVAIFGQFSTSFSTSSLLVYNQNGPKWTKNEFENEPKMARKFLL